jgi:hypothetical protein
MTERPKEPKRVDVSLLTDEKVAFDLRTAETPEERQSRLKREETEAAHKLRTQEAEDAHKRRISLILHIFVVAIVTIAFLASIYIAVDKDPKTGLPDKAMGIIMTIVAAGVGYMTGKASK